MPVDSLQKQVKAIRRYGIGAEIPRGHAGFFHGCPIQASKPRSLNRHGRRRPTIHEFACTESGVRSDFPMTARLF